jgi:hypothetical protein
MSTLIVIGVSFFVIALVVLAMLSKLLWIATTIAFILWIFGVLGITGTFVLHLFLGTVAVSIVTFLLSLLVACIKE